ncbi:MAG: DUF4494 domain-containing protein [Bacteroidales bacterium]|nr:DUF4494 domain-containing protein [Bacteroidales bacterium]
MNSYFEVAVRYDKVLADGTPHKVTEQFLLDALSFTEAEARATDSLADYIAGEFRVVAEKILNVSEVVTTADESADRYYKLKYNIITVDEKSGKDKKQPQYVIIQAKSVDDARDRFQAYIKGWMADTELEAISETKYLDYFPYNKTNNNQTTKQQ